MALPILVKGANPGSFWGWWGMVHSILFPLPACKFSCISQLLMSVDLQYCYHRKVSVLASVYAVNLKTVTHIPHTPLDS